MGQGGVGNQGFCVVTWQLSVPSLGLSVLTCEMGTLLERLHGVLVFGTEPEAAGPSVLVHSFILASESGVSPVLPGPLPAAAPEFPECALRQLQCIICSLLFLTQKETYSPSIFYPAFSSSNCVLIRKQMRNLDEK